MQFIDGYSCRSAGILQSSVRVRLYVCVVVLDCPMHLWSRIDAWLVTMSTQLVRQPFLIDNQDSELMPTPDRVLHWWYCSAILGSTTVHEYVRTPCWRVSSNQLTPISKSGQQTLWHVLYSTHCILNNMLESVIAGVLVENDSLYMRSWHQRAGTSFLGIFLWPFRDSIGCVGWPRIMWSSTSCSGITLAWYVDQLPVFLSPRIEHSHINDVGNVISDIRLEPNHVHWLAIGSSLHLRVSHRARLTQTVQATPWWAEANIAVGFVIFFCGHCSSASMSYRLTIHLRDPHTYLVLHQHMVRSVYAVRDLSNPSACWFSNNFFSQHLVSYQLRQYRGPIRCHKNHQPKSSCQHRELQIL